MFIQFNFFLQNRSINCRSQLQYFLNIFFQFLLKDFCKFRKKCCEKFLWTFFSCWHIYQFFLYLRANYFKIFKNRNFLAMKRLLSIRNHATISELIRKIDFSPSRTGFYENFRKIFNYVLFQMH